MRAAPRVPDYYKVLNRLPIRAGFDPASVPSGYLSAGTLIDLLERREHAPLTEEEQALPLADSRVATIRAMDGRLIRAVESGRNKQGWFYTATGVLGPTLEGPLTTAEAAEVRRKKEEADRLFAIEIAAKSKKDTGEHHRSAATALAGPMGWLCSHTDGAVCRRAARGVCAAGQVHEMQERRGPRGLGAH